MLQYVFVYFSVMIVLCNQQQYRATKGYVWPLPRFEEKTDGVFYGLEPSSFNIKTTIKRCKILVKAVQRVIATINNLKNISTLLRRRHGATPSLNNNIRYIKLKELSVELRNPCEVYPHYKMNENYTLEISIESLLSSDSVWGILHGLETFSQLLFISNKYDLLIQRTVIADSPLYPHRGLLLDTSRHYISPITIYMILDSMAMNKLNVFHWHIVDDQSFPFQSEKFPEFSEQGAYHPSLVYTKSTVRDIVEYARQRGIRVIPEFDVPGHSLSWGNSHPVIMVNCPTQGLLDPVTPATHHLLEELLREAQELFPDQYFHLGGDEVNYTCWYEHAGINQFMLRHNIVNSWTLLALFLKKTTSYLRAGTVPIVWQDLFHGDLKRCVLKPNDVVVQVWKRTDAIVDTSRLINSGYHVIFSSYWYLDHLTDTFEDMYKDPRHHVLKEVEASNVMNIIGGEACMWTESVDDANVLSVIWPRASAMAEILWNPEARTPIYQRRIVEHACRMRARGIPVPPPTGPGFCLLSP